MSITEYRELTKSVINQPIVSLTQKSESKVSLENVVDMLTMWGGYNRYKSCCGYKRVSLMFSSLYQTRNSNFIMDDIEVIEKILLKLKNSLSEKQQLQYAILEAYYKGIDVIVDGYDWSQKLTIRDIAEYLHLPKSTVSNRKKAAEQFILNELAELNQW